MSWICFAWRQAFGIVLGCLVLQGVAGAALFEENFGNTKISKGTLLPISASDKFTFWFAPDNEKEPVEEGKASHAWTWNQGSMQGFFSKASAEEQRWLLRDLRDGAVIDPGTAVKDPELSVLLNMNWGGNTDPSMFYNLALLDVRGNGYVAELGRAGMITLYRLDNGLHGGWVQLSSEKTDIQFNTIRVTFAVEKGRVSVSSTLPTEKNAPGPELTVDDTHYRQFVIIGFSGLGKSSSVSLNVRQVKLDGSLTK